MTGSLSQAAETALRDLFQDYEHVPSPAQWGAIRDLLDHLQRAADGRLGPAVYVSAIPAGTGKSTSLMAFALALTADPGYADTGMLLAVNRLDEVKDIARGLNACRPSLAIMVGRDSASLTELGGCEDPNEARIIITTQACLKARLRGLDNFDDAACYHYRGQRRSVVCWDEAIAFNRPIVLDNDTLSRLAGPMREQSPAATLALKQWSLDLETAQTGPCAVPDFESLAVDFLKLEEAVSGDDDLAAAAKALSELGGDRAWVHQDNTKRAGAVVSQLPELPHSLTPVIVTDASAAIGVNDTAYAQMGEARPVVRLMEAPKTYANLTMRIVPMAASRSAFRNVKKAEGLLAAALEYVRSVAPEDVLIVTYKAALIPLKRAKQTVREAIEARLTNEERGRTHFLTWGKHSATNDYQKAKHVIILGLPFQPQATSYAASGAALNRPMRTDAPEDHPTGAQVKDMAYGMLKDAVFQAVLRGAARKGLDGDCGPMKAVIFQDPRSGIKLSDYETMFPQSRILKDRTREDGELLKGATGKLSEIIEGHLKEGRTTISSSTLRTEMGVKDWRNIRRLFERPEMVEWMDGQGLRVRALNDGSRAVVRVPIG